MKLHVLSDLHLSVSGLEPPQTEWIHGYTHDSFDYGVNGTRIVCNPRGYAKNGVNENAAFEPGLIIDLD